MAAPVRANCLLISANTMASPYPVYPLGIAHLMGALQAHGHRAHHVDILADGGTDGLRQRLTNERFDVIGLSIRNIDTVDSSDDRDLLARMRTILTLVRDHSRAPIVLGGPGFSIMPEELLDSMQGDYGVVGEGETAFPRLIDQIMDPDLTPPRLTHGNSRSSSWPQPVFDHHIAAYYLDHGGMLNVQTKRGCNHHCSYCSYPTIEGTRLRCREPEQVAEEVQRLTVDHQARYIFFTDGVFNDPHDHYLQVAEALIRMDNTTPWCAFFRPQHLDREKLHLLKRSGLAAMELGTDGASDTTIRALNKGFTFDEVVTVNEQAVAESIPCAHFIMFGGPDETEATVLEGLENIDRLPVSVVFAYLGIRIFPGTHLQRRGLDEGLIRPDQSLLRPAYYFSPQVTSDFMETRLSRSFANRMDRIFLYDKVAESITMLHQMGLDGPGWDGLIRKKLAQ